MPTPLYIKDIIDADIDTPRSGNADGYEFSFESADGGIGFGTIDDNANSFSDDESSETLVALRVKLTLGSDAAFALEDFDFITLTIKRYDSEEEINIWFPANTESSQTIYYIDVDGNTYEDAALTTPAGGVLIKSDSVTIGETIGNYEYELSKTDTVSVLEELSIIENILNIYLEDFVYISETLTIGEIISMIINLYDRVIIGEEISFSGPLWSEEEGSSIVWVEE